MSVRRIRVFERSEIRVGDRGFEERDLALLARFEEEHKLGAFELGWRKLKLKEHVGVFAAGDLVLEILPKAEPLARREDAALEKKWSRALRRMLEIAYNLPLESAGLGFLADEEGSLLDVFALHFLDLVHVLVRGGLAKGYRRIRERIPGVRGKVVAGDLGIEALVHRERLLCEHDIYDRDIPHNQLLALAISVLRFAPLAPTTIKRASKLFECFPDPKPIHATEGTFDSLQWDRRTDAYKPAMDFARFILLGLSPAQRVGDVQVLALLFAMNDLFEAYIGSLVAKAARSRGYSVRLQPSRRFWEKVSVRPDIVLESRGKRIILDTKWKILSSAAPNMNDLRQMYVYNRYFDSDQAYLVYPDIHGLERPDGKFRPPDQDLSCGLLFVKMFNGESLDLKLGEHLLDLPGFALP